MNDIFKQLADFESPGSLIGDIDIKFSSKSLPIGMPTIEQCNYFRADEPDLIVLAARPSCGKSALLCQVAYQLGLERPALLFSLEMSKEQLKGRLLAMATETPLNALKEMPKPQLTQLATKLTESKLIIDDTNGLDINTLYNRTVSRHRRDALGAVFVDYLQIVGSPTSRSKTEEISFIAQRLKELARELSVPVVVAAQMSRNIEGRIAVAKDKSKVVPIMSDVADSAGIEKWADTLIFLHKQFVNGAQSQNQVGGYVAKARHGQLKDFQLHFRGDLQRFYDRGFLEEGI